MSRSARHHRGSAVVTLCVVRINTTEVTPSSKHPTNVIRPFCGEYAKHIAKNNRWRGCLHTKANRLFSCWPQAATNNKKKTTALRQSSGELAGARMSRSARHHRGSAVVTHCVVRINTTEVTPSSKHPANVERLFCGEYAKHIAKNNRWRGCLHTRANRLFSCWQQAATNKKRRPPHDSRLVNSLGLEPRTPTLKVLCSTC